MVDSTFLGVLAGTALELRKGAAPGSVVLSRVGARNVELIRNLGLHRLVTGDSASPGLGRIEMRHSARSQEMQ